MVSGLWHHSVMHSHNSPADEWDDEQSSEANEQRSMVGFAKYDQVDCGFCSCVLPSPVLAFCRRGRALTGRWLGGCGCRLASASRSSGARQASPWTASAGIWRRHTCTFHVGSTGMGESWRGSPSHQGGTDRRCRMRCTRSFGRMGQLMQLLLGAGVGAMGHGTLATGPWALSATVGWQPAAREQRINQPTNCAVHADIGCRVPLSRICSWGGAPRRVSLVPPTGAQI